MTRTCHPVPLANTTLGTVKVTAAATASRSMFIVFSKETAFPTAGPWTGVETERLFLWCPVIIIIIIITIKREE